jgi:hypothetical protein
MSDSGHQTGVPAGERPDFVCCLKYATCSRECARRDHLYPSERSDQRPEAVGAKPVAYNPWREFIDATCGDSAGASSGEATGSAVEAPLRKAVEFAEYMAKGAEQLLAALYAEDALRLRREEFDDVPEDEVYDAGTSRNEFATGLRHDIYEFRKRVPAASGN